MPTSDCRSYHHVWNDAEDTTLRRAVAQGHSFTEVHLQFFRRLTYRQVHRRIQQLGLKRIGTHVGAVPKGKSLYDPHQDRVRWTKEMDHIIHDWRAAGRKYKDIARQLGVTPLQCRHRAGYLRLPAIERACGGGLRVWTQEEEDTLLKYRRDEMPVSDIALRLKRSEPSIYQRLQAIRDRAYKPKPSAQQRPWSPEEEEILEKWGRGHLTGSDLLAQYPKVFDGRTIPQLNAKATRMGLRPHLFAPHDKELIQIMLNECPEETAATLAMNMPAKWIMKEMLAASEARVRAELAAEPQRKKPTTIEEIREELESIKKRT